MEGLIREKLNWQKGFPSEKKRKEYSALRKPSLINKNKMVLLKRNVKEQLKVRAGKKVV